MDALIILIAIVFCVPFVIGFAVLIYGLWLEFFTDVWEDHHQL